MGDYVEFVAHETSHTRQGHVLARVDKIEPKGRKGQWAQVIFLALPDEHLTWWLIGSLSSTSAAPSSAAARNPAVEGERTFHTDKFRVVTMGDLARKKIDWVAKGPHQKFVKDELDRLTEAGERAGHPDAGPSRVGLGFAEAEAAAADPGQGQEKVETQLAALEQELEHGKAGRKRKTVFLRPSHPRGREKCRARTRSAKARYSRTKSRKETGVAEDEPLPCRIRPSQVRRQAAHLIWGTRNGRKRTNKRRIDLQIVEHSSGKAPESPTGVFCPMVTPQIFGDAPSSQGGKSLQLQLRECSLKRPGRLTQTLVAREGGNQPT